MAPTLQRRAWALVRFLAFAVLSAFLFVIALLLIAMLLITPVGLPLQRILALQVPTEIFAAPSASALMARCLTRFSCSALPWPRKASSEVTLWSLCRRAYPSGRQ